MRKLCLLSITTVLLFLLTSCDFTYRYTYTVTNQSDKIITIKTDIVNNYDFTVQDSIYIIRPSESIKIIDEEGGICGRHYIPDNRYTENDTIPRYKKFDIYIGDNTLISKRLRLYKYWNFIAKERLGKYELKVTNDLLDLN